MSLNLNPRRRLRIVAAIDILKGLTILSVGLGILRAQSHVLEHGGQALLRLLDLDPSTGAPFKFLEFLQAADLEHGLLMVFAAAYALLRFVESYGLWFTRSWARWLGLISSGIYVPFELYYFVKSPGWTTLSVLSINLIVIWLLWPTKKPIIISLSSEQQ
ncbi:MAG: DUF2127 domain-containing protein [Arenimonas sp.]